MSATTRALELPELLENILHHLPTKDLLLAQRVSKHWLHLIKGSKSLRQALFYEPEEVKDVWAAGRKLNYFPEVIACVPRNSNVEDLFIPPFHTVWQIVPVHVNELLLTRIDYGSAPCDFRRPAQGGDDCDVELRLSHAIASEGRASWKRMFLTQPPVTKVVINATIESIEMVLAMHMSTILMTGLLTIASVFKTMPGFVRAMWWTC